MITVFASREISLISMISDIQFQMNLLSQKRMNLASVGMILADGQVSPDEIQQSNYYVQNGLAGAINLGNALSQQSAMMGQPMQMVYRNQMNPNIISFHSYAKEQADAQLAAQEKVIDMQMKQLETKLSMYERELESVGKGKERSIETATPKYA
jgi:hypothetical protein